VSIDEQVENRKQEQIDWLRERIAGLQALLDQHNISSGDALAQAALKERVQADREDKQVMPESMSLWFRPTSCVRCLEVTALLEAGQTAAGIMKGDFDKAIKSVYTDFHDLMEQYPYDLSYKSELSDDEVRTRIREAMAHMAHDEDRSPWSMKTFVHHHAYGKLIRVDGQNDADIKTEQN